MLSEVFILLAASIFELFLIIIGIDPRPFKQSTSMAATRTSTSSLSGVHLIEAFFGEHKVSLIISEAFSNGHRHLIIVSLINEQLRISTVEN